MRVLDNGDGRRVILINTSVRVYISILIAFRFGFEKKNDSEKIKYSCRTLSLVLSTFCKRYLITL